MDKWEYQNRSCHLENRVVRERCKQRTACTNKKSWNFMSGSANFEKERGGKEDESCCMLFLHKKMFEILKFCFFVLFPKLIQTKSLETLWVDLQILRKRGGKEDESCCMLASLAQEGYCVRSCWKESILCLEAGKNRGRHFWAFLEEVGKLGTSGRGKKGSRRNKAFYSTSL